MQAQELTLEELKQLYQSRISRDFVPNELRPWGNMRALALRGAYRAFAYREKGAVLAYGIFAHCPGAALLDYLAVDPALRGGGLGTRFFQALQGAARQLGAPFSSLRQRAWRARKPQRRRRSAAGASSFTPAAAAWNPPGTPTFLGWSTASCCCRWRGPSPGRSKCGSSCSLCTT